MATGSTVATSALEVEPKSTLQFVLKSSDVSTSSGDSNGFSRCEMTLKHPANTDEYWAFKVKTTQPRRYLVRPNQGVIEPGNTKKITIFLVEKDRQLLLQSYERLGQSALDQLKDKFLVQSCIVAKSKYVELGSNENPKFTDALSSMWNQAGSDPNVHILNKKLHVKHVISEGSDENTVTSSSQPSLNASPGGNMENHFQKTDRPQMDVMSHEQLLTEVSSLRRKYDELVAFSVNLTSERDVLNNTLEQTKRDLNREMAARTSIENIRSKWTKMQQRQIEQRGDFTLSIIQIIVVGIACFLAGIAANNGGLVPNFLGSIPLISSLLGY